MAKCCDYSAGKMRTPVSFERYTRVTDGAGGATVTWAAVSGAPTRAAVRQTSGYERYMAERVEAQSAIKVVVRYTSVLKERDRVLVDGSYYNIARIDDVEFAHKWLEITATGGVAT